MAELPVTVAPARLRIVVLGGGTGTFTVLTGLKYHELDISAVVSTSDDGGSTGILRSELGVLPPGDIRQCLVALSDGDEILRRMFNYRFSEGSLSGHNFGNLFLTVLEKVCKHPLEAVRQAHNILRERGQVIPVSEQATQLFARLVTGEVINGEHAIDETTVKRAPIDRCFIDPEIEANPDAIDAIRKADAIVMGPGDLFTSLIPVILVGGIVDAICESRATRILVTNLVTKHGQTDGFKASDFCRVVEEYIGPAKLDRIIVNTSEPPPEVLKAYEEAEDQLVVDDLGHDTRRIFRAPLISDRMSKKVAGDKLKRSVLRHDPAKLATAILESISPDRTTDALGRNA
ncbi:YvcK family protein [Candidatus Uhrbacteria bacterium]|nr:YvcK family protein [Candidatus Uhrbacteria bacterium]